VTSLCDTHAYLKHTVGVKCIVSVGVKILCEEVSVLERTVYRLGGDIKHTRNKFSVHEADTAVSDEEILLDFLNMELNLRFP
jgi:hypothetical protein